MLVLIFLLTSITLALYFYWNKNDYWKKRNIVQVNGTFFEVVLGKKSAGEAFKKLYEDYPKELYVGTFFNGKPAVVLRDLTDIQTVLATEFNSFNNRGFSFNDNDTLADNVLMISDVKRWRLLRHKLTPMFTSLKLRNMYYILDKCAQDFTKRITENPEFVEKPYEAMVTYTLSSVTASVFGIDANVENTMDNPLLQTAKKTLEFSMRAAFFQALASISPGLLKVLNVKTFGPHEEFFVGAFKRAVEERRKEGRKCHDLVDLFLELQKQGTMKDAATGYEIEPSVEVVAAQGWFFFLAGTDTSATTMHFTLLELASNPEILQRVHEEIDRVFEECEEKMTYNELEKLQYLDMVVHEAMRKYPPIGHLTRQCMKTSTLPGGLTVEEGSLVVVPAFAIHRDEKYYPEPEKFDPERFSSEKAGDIPNYANLSFGEGNRICIGSRYAMVQVKAGLSWLLRRYSLRPQRYDQKKFEPSFFATKDTKARYDFVPRK